MLRSIERVNSLAGKGSGSENKVGVKVVGSSPSEGDVGYKGLLNMRG